MAKKSTKRTAPKRKKATAKKPVTRASKKSHAKSPKAILKHYMAGASLAELKAKFGLRGKSQLGTAVLDAMIAEKKLPPLVKGGGQAKKAIPKEFTVKVGSKGTVILPKRAVVESFEYKAGQTFKVAKKRKKIILTAS